MTPKPPTRRLFLSHLGSGTTPSRSGSRPFSGRDESEPPRPPPRPQPGPHPPRPRLHPGPTHAVPPPRIRRRHPHRPGKPDPPTPHLRPNGHPRRSARAPRNHLPHRLLHQAHRRRRRLPPDRTGPPGTPPAPPRDHSGNTGRAARNPPHPPHDPHLRIRLHPPQPGIPGHPSTPGPVPPRNVQTENRRLRPGHRSQVLQRRLPPLERGDPPNQRHAHPGFPGKGVLPPPGNARLLPGPERRRPEPDLRLCPAPRAGGSRQQLEHRLLPPPGQPLGRTLLHGSGLRPVSPDAP